MSRRLVLLLALASLLPVPALAAEERTWEELKAQAEVLYREKRIPDAVRVAEEAAAEAERKFGPEHVNAAIALDGLVTMYRLAAEDAKTRYLRSGRLLEHALAVAEKAEKPDDPIVLSIVHNLAKLYHSQRRYTEAEQLYQRALEGWEQAPEPNTLRMASALYQLAEVHEAQGKRGEAEAERGRARKWLSERVEPPAEEAAAPAPDTAPMPPAAAPVQAIEASAPATLAPSELPALSNAAPPADPAVAELRWKLAAMEESLGPDHTAVAILVSALGQLYASQGRYEEAEPLHQRSLAINEKAYTEAHETVAKDLSNLAELYRLQARYADAEAVYARLLGVLERIVDDKHPDIGLVLIRYAECLEKTGNTRDAHTMRARAKKLGF